MLETNYGTATIRYVHSNGTIITTEFTSEITYIKTFPNLEVKYHMYLLRYIERNLGKSSNFSILQQADEYSYSVQFSKTAPSYSLVTVSSKAGSNQTLPYRTSCWASSDDTSGTPKIYVSAQVEQGNRPVLHAKVRYMYKLKTCIVNNLSQ